MKGLLGAIAFCTAVILLLLLSSCRTIDAGGCGFNALPEDQRKKLLECSVVLGNDILAAFRDSDYPAFRKAMPAELAKDMTEKDFLDSIGKFRTRFGVLQDFRLLASLDTPAFVNLIWITTFMKKGANGADIRRQLLFRLLTMTINGRTQVVSFGFL